jgi:syntaxin 18
MLRHGSCFATAQAARTGWQHGTAQQPASAPQESTSAQQQQRQQQQQQQLVDAENVALQQQLLALGGEVTAMERSMRDVAALNQMFSAQVLQQSQQIEQLFSEVSPLTSASLSAVVLAHRHEASSA